MLEYESTLKGERFLSHCSDENTVRMAAQFIGVDTGRRRANKTAELRISDWIARSDCRVGRTTINQINLT